MKNIAYDRPQNIIQDKKRLVLTLILLFGLLKGFLFISLVPKWRAPDEPAYFHEIKVVAEEHKIPGLTAAKYIEHPPLYYVASYPFYTLGKMWGTKGIVLAIRFFGILLLVATAFIGYLTAKKMFPDNYFIQSTTTALIMLNPQLTFISGSINSDVLLNLFFALLFWQSVLLVREGVNLKRALIIALIVTGGLYTKERFLIAVLSLAFLVSLLVFRAGWKLVKSRIDFSSVKNMRLLAPLLLIVSPFLVYKSLTSTLNLKQLNIIKNAFSPAFGEYLFRQFWGDFDWLQISMSDNIYAAFNLLPVLALSGFVVALLNMAGRFSFRVKRQKESDGLVAGGEREIINTDRLIIYLFFIFSIILTLIATSNYHIYGAGAQGRYLFVIAVPYFILIVYGLSKLADYGHSKTLFTLIFCGLFLLNIIALFQYIVPYYYYS